MTARTAESSRVLATCIANLERAFIAHTSPLQLCFYLRKRRDELERAGLHSESRSSNWGIAWVPVFLRKATNQTPILFQLNCLKEQLSNDCDALGREQLKLCLIATVKRTLVG